MASALDADQQLAHRQLDRARTQVGDRPGHLLADISLRVIGRRWDSDGILLSVEDGSNRVAQTFVNFRRSPPELPWPAASLFAEFAEWHRLIEAALVRRLLQPDPAIVPQLRKGDRIMMLKHHDSTKPARGTISRCGRPQVIWDGSTHVEYVIQFDELQPDLSGDPARAMAYSGTTVLKEFLRRLDSLEDHLRPRVARRNPTARRT